LYKNHISIFSHSLICLRSSSRAAQIWTYSFPRSANVSYSFSMTPFLTPIGFFEPKCFLERRASYHSTGGVEEEQKSAVCSFLAQNLLCVLLNTEKHDFKYWKKWRPFFPLAQSCAFKFCESGSGPKFSVWRVKKFSIYHPPL